MKETHRSGGLKDRNQGLNVLGFSPLFLSGFHLPSLRFLHEVGDMGLFIVVC